jgi:hypothetical protein
LREWRLFTGTGIFTDAVKKRELVKLQGSFEAEALRILRENPGLTVIAKPGGADREVDAVLCLGEARTIVAIEFKRRANAATAWQLVREADSRPHMPILLIAGETTAEARRILEEHGVAVVDGLGNAHIELPGLLLHTEGRRRPYRHSVKNPPAQLRGKAGIAAQALLLHPERGWQVQDLAKAAKVSAGLAHRVLARLEREGILASEGTGPNRFRRVTNPAALLDLWAEENVERPMRTLGHLLAQSPQQLIKALGGNLERSSIDYALTGPAAASLIAPSVTAIPVIDVWVSAVTAPKELYEAAHADAVTEGQNIVFLQAKDDTPLAFRDKVSGLWVANRFRLYADLRRDPRRGREQAEHLRREVIGF